jgi:hypothetical protein
MLHCSREVCVNHCLIKHSVMYKFSSATVYNWQISSMLQLLHCFSILLVSRVHCFVVAFRLIRSLTRTQLINMLSYMFRVPLKGYISCFKTRLVSSIYL